jgi:hypothetical protein
LWGGELYKAGVTNRWSPGSTKCFIWSTPCFGHFEVICLKSSEFHFKIKILFPVPPSVFLSGAE